MLKTYEQICQRYLEEAKAIAKWVVLKTDAHNESGIYPVSLPIAPHLNCDICYCLEYDEEVIGRALKREWERTKIMKWDIRMLPFEQDSIDTLIDLSTIDHIAPKDIDKVLQWYNKVLKKWWKCLLVVRTWHPWDDVVVDSMIAWTERHPWNQYYFKREWFEDLLKKYFQIDYSEDLFSLWDNIDGWNLLVLYRMTNV